MLNISSEVKINHHMCLSYISELDLEDNIWDVWKISEGISSTLPIHSSFWKNRWWWQNILSNTHKKTIASCCDTLTESFAFWAIYFEESSWKFYFGHFLEGVLESLISSKRRKFHPKLFVLRQGSMLETTSKNRRYWSFIYVSFHQFSEPNQNKYWEKQSFR